MLIVSNVTKIIKSLEIILLLTGVQGKHTPTYFSGIHFDIICGAHALPLFYTYGISTPTIRIKFI
jgi:hypothetical protein